MENETGNLFANDGTFLYMRLDGVYYKRPVGKIWQAVKERPSANFHPMPEKQETLFRATLKEQGVLG
jgi:hypothetical protein